MARTTLTQGLLAGILASFLAACTGPGSIADTASSHSLTERVDALVAPLVAANEFSGAIVMVRDGRTLYSRGFGMANHASALAFTPDTPADGGSLAKTFTAAGIWWLAHEGSIDLDAAVQRYLPEYPHPQTSVRHLLSHSNGLPANYEFFEASFGPGEERTTQQMLRIVADQAPRPSFEPGTQFEYSSLGFDVAGLVIERVTGQSYAAFVNERFFSPLGLRSSFARPAHFADWTGIRTVGYRWLNGTWQLNDSFDHEGFLGGSNLYFTAADLVRWGSANARGVALPTGAFEAGQQQLSIGGQALGITGLSWYCDRSMTRCNYTGHHAGFHHFVFWDREHQDSIAMISNSTLPAWTIASLQRELVNALADRPPDADVAPAFLDIFDMDPSEIAGSYTAEELPVMTIGAVQGGGVKIRLGNGLEYAAYPASRQVLYVPGLDFYLALSGEGTARTLHVKAQELNAMMRLL